MHETSYVIGRDSIKVIGGQVYVPVPSEAVTSLRKTYRQAEYIRCTYHPVVEKRRMNQNNLYQTLIKEMCQGIGNDSAVDVEQMKDLVKARAVYLGYPCEKDENGLDVFVGDMPVPRSSADVSVEEFELLIEACYRVAEDSGIFLRRR